MIRLLVVDDEELITDSLAYMLEGLEEPTLEVSRAYSAPEALALLNRQVYDIVVSDIQMPGMSGIDLLREVHVKWPSCHLIFLTGYDEFDYAYQALKYGASGFVLKNEGDEVLVASIRACVEKIQKEAARPPAHAQPVGPAQARHAADGFLRALLVGGAPETQRLEGEIDRLGLRLRPHAPLMLMVGRVDRELTENLLAMVDEIVWDRVGHALRAEVVKVDRQLALWLLQPAQEGNEEHARAAITGLAEAIQEACRATLGLRLTFVLDPEPVGWPGIPERFAGLRHAAANQLQEDSGIALAKIAYFSGQPAAEDSGSLFVQRLMQYIKANPAADLSLTALSELVYLNPAYLSRRFKELTGQNITDTILQLRMELACRLLRESHQKVGKVAAAAGYESAAHFSRVFKRFTGLTPQEYRDSHLVL